MYLKMDSELARKAYKFNLIMWAALGLLLALWDWRVTIGWFASGLIIPKIEMKKNEFDSKDLV